MPANSNTAPVTQASSSTAAAAAVGPPPAKSRRKAHKPQRINHCPEEMECGEVVEGNKTTTQEVDNNRGSDAASNRGSSGVESNGGQLTTTVAAAAPVRASSETKPSVNVDKKESSRDVREKKVNEASPATWMDVAENLSTKGENTTFDFYSLFMFYFHSESRDLEAGILKHLYFLRGHLKVLCQSGMSSCHA